MTYYIPLSIVNMDLTPVDHLAYSTLGSGCFDIPSAEYVVIPAGEQRIISTGLRLLLRAEDSSVWMLQLYPRSGLASKYGLTMINAPAIIDQDYEGEIQVILINHSKNDYEVHIGDRIAQATFVPVFRHRDIQQTKAIRGGGGLGSTGY